MKKAVIWVLFLCVTLAQSALSEKKQLPDIGVTALFPDEYTVVTQNNVRDHTDFFVEGSAEDIEREMILSGVHAIAFSPEEDVQLRLIAVDGDETAKLYYDVERYTSAMRSEIRNYFLDRTNFEAEGIRYSEAEWTNKPGQGRLLRMSYNVRIGEEVVARGRQAYTIRNGMAFTLDMRVSGRTVTSADELVFEAFVAGTLLPRDEDMPLLPVGLTLAAPLPEEVYKPELSVRGTTTRGAAVAAYFQPNDSDPMLAAETVASNNGSFQLDITLPHTGDTRLYIVASLTGLEDSDVGGWINYEPNRLPVNFTAYPKGVVTDSQIYVTGKTIGGVVIQCMEGEENQRITTGSDGSFSFKLDRMQTGERTVVLSFTKDAFNNRRFTFNFDREWLMEDYVKQLDKQVKSLSYQRLTDEAERYAGRIVRYSGLVVQVSGTDGRTYVELASKQEADGTWDSRIIAVAEGIDVALAEGDMADIYFEVTTERYSFPSLSEAEDGSIVELPAVKLLAYQKK